MAGEDEFHDDNPPPPLPVTPTQQAPHTLSTIKLLILKKGLPKIMIRFSESSDQLEIPGAGCTPLNMSIKKFLININLAFVSSKSTNSTNDVSTAYDVSTSSSHNSQKEGSSSYTDELKVLFLLSNPIKDEGCSLMPRNQLALTRPRLSTLIAITHDTLLESADQKEIKKAEEDMQGTLDIKQNTIGGDLENRRNLKLCNSGSDTEVTSCSKECVESYAKLEKLYDKQREQLSDASIEICSALSLEYEHVAKTRLCWNRISIFTVNTFVSLGCSSNTTRIMRRTLMITLVFTLCEEQVWNSVLMRLIDDLLALDSIVRFGFSDRRLERTATFSISTNSE
ncbi:hypothetical protein Tco_0491195 [Tanacetum coccineum]